LALISDKERFLSGRTALITGASRGIGLAIAHAYAGHGANLILSATNKKALEHTKNALSDYDVEVSIFSADLTVMREVDRLFSFCVERQPLLDTLVNNAGIHIGKPFTEYEMDEFDRLMKLNVYSVFRLTQLFIRHSQALGRGKVINIASTAGLKESPNQVPYNTSKHAVVGMTKCVALENARNGITVNAICPGIVETDLIKNVETKMEATGMSRKEFRQRIEEQITIGRMLQPREIASIAVFLASREADGMTGQTLTI
jgi:meso-butanediol dehydrogenase/(S,S)-butanediol dehydrogenase/diacetyl reductase